MNSWWLFRRLAASFLVMLYNNWGWEWFLIFLFLLSTCLPRQNNESTIQNVDWHVETESKKLCKIGRHESFDFFFPSPFRFPQTWKNPADHLTSCHDCGGLSEQLQAKAYKLHYSILQIITLYYLQVQVSFCSHKYNEHQTIAQKKKMAIIISLEN